MRLFLILIIFFQLGFLTGCCVPNKRNEPRHPGQVSGWIDDLDKDAGVRRLGSFVLRKGESTSNGNVKVELVDIIPPEPCASDAGTPGYKAHAVLRFVKVQDSRVLLTDRFTEGVGNTVTNDTSEIGAVGINSINVRDGWVHFSLLGFFER